MTLASILWRRLDTPGHDACRLEQSDVGWILDGMAFFCQNGIPSFLDYRVEYDLKWHTEQGYVQGWIGTQSVELSILQTGGSWTLNGATIPNLENCIDLDPGFTPATNMVPLRRLALRDGQAADAPAVWLNVSAGTLGVLLQHYERRTETKYWYKAPSVDYAAMLEVNQIGFIHRYPGLWEVEMCSSTTPRSTVASSLPHATARED